MLPNYINRGQLPGTWGSQLEDWPSAKLNPIK
jgi:hypothetical protein